MIHLPMRVRTDGDGKSKGAEHTLRRAKWGGVERPWRGVQGLGGEGGWVNEQAEEEVSWRRAVELLLAGSLLGNS